MKIDLAFLKENKTKILILSVLIIIPSTFGIIFTINYFHMASLHPPIIIESDADFISYDFPGNGTQENPYLIEDYIISANGGFTMGISVSNTNSYFIIQNCLIYTNFFGIGLQEVASGTSWIINNTCISKSRDAGGIVLNQMTNCTISGNTCGGFMQGIHLNYVSYSLIESNMILGNYYQGINIRYSSYNLIVNNTVMYTPQHAIALVGNADYNTIYNNILINNAYSGIYQVDNRLTGTLSSQGFDEGNNNYWYNYVTDQGNYWSDHQGIGSYSIDGPAGTEDLYPL